MLKSHKQHPLLNLVFAILIVAGLMWGFVATINHPRTLQELLPLINKYSKIEIGAQRIKWNPLLSKFEAKHLSFKSKKLSIYAPSITLKYNPISLFTGKIRFGYVQINSPEVEIFKAKEKKEGLKRLSSLHTFFLKNIVIDKSEIISPKLRIEDKLLSVYRSELSFKQSLFGDTSLELIAEGTELRKFDEVICNAESIKIGAKTKIERWSSDFPFITDIKGKINLSKAWYKDIELESAGISADISYPRIEIDPASIGIKDGEIKGKISYDDKNRTVALAIDVLEPIKVPYIIKPIYSIDTAGKFKGSVKISGELGHGIEDFNLFGEIDAQYEFQKYPISPLKIQSAFNMKSQILSIDKFQATSKDDTAFAEGTFDFKKKAMNIHGHTEGFPAEAVFANFKDPNLARIFGKSKADAVMTGWGKDFKIDLTGNTPEGGWHLLKAKNVMTDLSVTYKQLKAVWRIDENNAEKIKADLLIDYGKTLPDSTREKDIKFNGTVKNYNVANTLEAFNLTGMLNGKIDLAGRNKNVKGVASISLAKGKYYTTPFDLLETTLQVNAKKLVFENTSLSMRELEEVAKIQPVHLDVMEDGNFKLYGSPVDGLDFAVNHRSNPNAWKIEKLIYKNDGNLTVKGELYPGERINIFAEGNIDLKRIAPFIPFLNGFSGLIDLGLHAFGNPISPSLNGKIEFDDVNAISRGNPYMLEQLNGTLLFSNKNISFKDVKGRMGDGNLLAEGSISHSNGKLERTNLNIKGTGIEYSDPMGNFTVEMDGEINLIGNMPAPLLKGKITLVDGKYTKDFSPLASKKSDEIALLMNEDRFIDFNPALDIQLLCRGDFMIKNNIGEIWLSSDARIKGTKSSPKVQGTISTNEGIVNYLGLNFDIKKGFLEFRERGLAPYLEVEAEREIKTYNATLLLHGKIDNLVMDLSSRSSSGALDRADTINLIAFGSTEDEMRKSSMAGGQFGPAMVAQQLSGFVEGPVTKLTHLDVFRLEASDPTKSGVSRLYFGKQLSDRLSLDFATDINTQSAVQTVNVEYQLIDHLLLKASRSSDDRLAGTMTIRFRLR